MSPKRNIKDHKFKVGDVFVKLGKLYKLFKIKTKKVNGKDIEFLFYKNLYFNKKKGNIIHSIPSKNIGLTNSRLPLIKNDFKDFFNDLGKKPSQLKVDLKKYKDIVYSDSLDRKSTFVNKVWYLKKEDDISVSVKELFNKVIESVAKEIAYVFDISLDKAKEKIFDNFD